MFKFYEIYPTGTFLAHLPPTRVCKLYSCIHIVRSSSLVLQHCKIFSAFSLGTINSAKQKQFYRMTQMLIFKYLQINKHLLLCSGCFAESAIKKQESCHVSIKAVSTNALSIQYYNIYWPPLRTKFQNLQFYRLSGYVVCTFLWSSNG
jgi:hypothetical protein